MLLSLPLRRTRLHCASGSFVQFPLQCSGHAFIYEIQESNPVLGRPQESAAAAAAELLTLTVMAFSLPLSW